MYSVVYPKNATATNTMAVVQQVYAVVQQVYAVVQQVYAFSMFMQWFNRFMQWFSRFMQWFSRFMQWFSRFMERKENERSGKRTKGPRASQRSAHRAPSMAKDALGNADGEGSVRESRRCPNNQTEYKEERVQARPSSPSLHCGVTFLPGQGFVSGLGQGLVHKALCMSMLTLANSRSTQESSTQIFCVMRLKKRDKKDCN